LKTMKIVSFLLPSDRALQTFLKEQEHLTYTYEPEGATRRQETCVPGYDSDRLRVRIGRGFDDFARAREAVRQWRMFPSGWTRILPAGAPIEPGVTVAMCARFLGAWWPNSCRIVYVVDEPDRFGFAYGTLPGHVERGEELFQVELDADGAVWYEIRAFSRPRHWLVRLAYPVVRLLQARLRRDSASAMGRGIKTSFGYNRVAFLGAILWIVVAAYSRPGLGEDGWARLVLLLAALVWVPLALERLRPRGERRLWEALAVGGAAVLLVGSMALPAGMEAALLALPWLAVTSAIFLGGVEALHKSRGKASATAVAAARMFILIGGLWACADRMGLQPWGFDPAITLLTAVHFHYAGFIFPLLIGWAADRWPGALFRISAWLAVVTVPLTAAGITAAHLGQVYWPEALTGAGVAAAGWLGAAGYIGVCFGALRSNGARLAWGIMAASLLFSMTLALAYAVRPYWPLACLDLPAMRAWHGTVNALGVAGGGLLGWLQADVKV
jgi:uncharacterized protein (UPF0548 family)